MGSSHLGTTADVGAANAGTEGYHEAGFGGGGGTLPGFAQGVGVDVIDGVGRQAGAVGDDGCQRGATPIVDEVGRGNDLPFFTDDAVDSIPMPTGW